MKHIKTGKRSHMNDAGTTKKQSTLFGAHSAEKAEAKCMAWENDPLFESSKFWDDEDLDALGLTKYGVDVAAILEEKKPSKIFRVWLEDWEEEILVENDPVNEAKFLNKYGGMVWYDPDSESTFTASCDQMFFNRKRGQDKGYCVFGVMETFDKDDPEHDDDWEPWALKDEDLYAQIVEHYKENPVPHIQIVEKQEDEPVAED